MSRRFDGFARPPTLRFSPQRRGCSPAVATHTTRALEGNATPQKISVPRGNRTFLALPEDGRLALASEIIANAPEAEELAEAAEWYEARRAGLGVDFVAVMIFFLVDIDVISIVAVAG